MTVMFRFWPYSIVNVVQGESTWEDHFSGTPDYASSHTLRGGRCSAKDDCESLCYSLLELWNGELVLYPQTF